MSSKINMDGKDLGAKLSSHQSEQSEAKLHSVSKNISTKSLKGVPSQKHSKTHNRKSSYGFSSVVGLKSECRFSAQGMLFKRPTLTYSPTYQLESNNPFHPPKVIEVVSALLEERFEGHSYSSVQSPDLAIQFTTEVLRKIKALNFNRYRILITTTVGQFRAQSYNNAIAFIWDEERDRYVNLQKDLPTVFVQITVFAIYLD